MFHVKPDAFIKSPPASLRGAKRRGNILDIRAVMRLLRFARNDKPAVFGLLTKPSIQRCSSIDQFFFVIGGRYFFPCDVSLSSSLVLTRAMFRDFSLAQSGARSSEGSGSPVRGWITRSGGRSSRKAITRLMYSSLERQL